MPRCGGARGRGGCDRLRGGDIESRVPGTGHLRFLEVKGRVTGADTVTVTKNEILTSLNKPDDFSLAIVEFLGADAHRVHYLRRPFRREPDFGVTSVNYDFAELLSPRGGADVSPQNRAAPSLLEGQHPTTSFV